MASQHVRDGKLVREGEFFDESPTQEVAGELEASEVVPWAEELPYGFALLDAGKVNLGDLRKKRLTAFDPAPIGLWKDSRPRFRPSRY